MSLEAPPAAQPAPPEPAAAAAPADDAEKPPAAAAEQQKEGKPVSKRSLKRQAKAERLAEQKKQRKANEKAQKQEAQQKRRAEVQKLLDGMTEEQKEQWQRERKDKLTSLMEAKKAAKARQQAALSAPQSVAIDLSFPGLMTPAELKSLSQQLSYSYSTAVAGQQQLHLHLLGAPPELQAVLDKQLPGHVHWAATISSRPYTEFFQERADDLVYLTADSPTELQALDPGKVYVIGGIVDRNRHKGLCFQRAQQAGVATARLPIAQHVKLQSSALSRERGTQQQQDSNRARPSASGRLLVPMFRVFWGCVCWCCCWLQVITVNQVVDILVRMQSTQDWKAVLDEVLPGRKRADAATAPGSSSGGGDAAMEAADGSADGSAEAADTQAAAAAADEGDAAADAADDS